MATWNTENVEGAGCSLHSCPGYGASGGHWRVQSTASRWLRQASRSPHWLCHGWQWGGPPGAGQLERLYRAILPSGTHHRGAEQERNKRGNNMWQQAWLVLEPMWDDLWGVLGITRGCRLQKGKDLQEQIRAQANKRALHLGDQIDRTQWNMGVGDQGKGRLPNGAKACLLS